MIKKSLKISWFTFAILSLYLVCSGNFAGAEEVNPLHLTSFQGGATLATQGGGSSFGIIGKYVPRYDIVSGANAISVGLDLGVTSFNDAGQSNFYVIQYGVSGGYVINPNIDASLAVGAQTWTGGNGTAFYAGPTVNYRFSDRLLYVLDGVYVSYNAVTQHNFANLISAGINFKF